MSGNGALVTFRANPQSFAQYVKQNQSSLRQIASSEIDLRRLYKITLACVSRTPALANCTITSIFRAMQQAAEVGLEYGNALGHAYLIPYKEEAQLILGYRGLLELVRRSGLVASVQAYCVYEGDSFDAALGDTPYIHHKPQWDGKRDDESIRYFYAIARLKDGTLLMEIMTKGEVDKIRGRSRAGNTGPWVTDYAEMGKKTVLRRLCKILPMSINAADAMEIDSNNEFGNVDTATGEILPPPRLEAMPKITPTVEPDPSAMEEEDGNPFVESPEAQTDEEIREVAFQRLIGTPNFKADVNDQESLRAAISALLNRMVARISALSATDFEDARQALLAHNAERTAPDTLMDVPAAPPVPAMAAGH